MRGRGVRAYDAAAGKGRKVRRDSTAFIPGEPMGFQDRGYYRASRPAFAPEWTGVTMIIAISVAVWLANFILTGDLIREIFPLRLCLNDIFSLRPDLPEHPLRFWQLLTYGFLHDGPSLDIQERLQAIGLTQSYSPFHLLGNMLLLWFFGREVEEVMGRAEFLRFYCVAIIMAGIAWVVTERFAAPGSTAPLVGASGGVMAVLAVFIWYFPNQTVYIYGVLPVPVWALGVLYLAFDFSGALGLKQPGAADTRLIVAHVAHLAGAAFGLLYAWRGWSLEELTSLPERLLRRRPAMRVVRPEDDTATRHEAEDDAALHEAVDRILAKISRSGESSLTADERETLTRASRRLKERSR